jgi:acetyltransferase-like isoleucine patch superfamily enzyme
MNKNLGEIIQPSNVNEHVYIGKDSKIWRYCNVYGTKAEPVIIGDNVQIGGNSEIKPGVKIKNNCRIQYGLFAPEGITINENVFIGPRVTFTNDKYPDIVKTLKGTWDRLETIVDSYVSIGAGAVIIPGVKIGKYAQIGAGTIVTKNIDDYAIIAGNPGKKVGDIRDEKFKHIYKRLLNEPRK